MSINFQKPQEFTLNNRSIHLHPRNLQWPKEWNWHRSSA